MFTKITTRIKFEIEELRERYGIESPIEKRLSSFVLANLILYSLKKKPKSVKKL